MYSLDKKINDEMIQQNISAELKFSNLECLFQFFPNKNDLAFLQFQKCFKKIAFEELDTVFDRIL